MNTASRFFRIAGLTLSGALTAALLLSCEEKEPVPVTIDSQPAEIAAEGGSTTFTFTAHGQWTAGIEPTSDGSDVSWLTIEPTSGEAGQHTVTLTAEANPSTGVRTASVIVDDGNSSASVTVSQAASSETPDNPEGTNLVKSVELYMSGEDGSYYWEFEYDDQNRVSKILRGYMEDGASSSDDINIQVTYNDGAVSLAYEYSDGTHSHISSEMDENGRISTIEEEFSGDFTLQYENNFLSDIENDADFDGIPDHHRLTWTDGNITSITQTYSEAGDPDELRYFYTDRTMPEDANIDINWLLKQGHGFFIDGGAQWFGVLGMLGERDTHYALPGYWWDPAPAGNSEQYDPNTMKDGETVTMEVESSGDHAYGEAKYECTVTDDGTLSGMTAEIPVYNILYKCTGTRKIITDESGNSYSHIEFTDTEEISRTLIETAVYKVTVTYY